MKLINIIKNIFFLCLILLISFNAYAQSVRVKIIETSDVHGAVFPYDFVNEKKSDGSLSQVFNYVQQQREDTNQVVVLLDNGDLLQGDPTSYYYNFIDTSGTHFFSQVMNYMNYDAGTVGNHDIETGHFVYDKYNKQINFPWLAANTSNTLTGETYFKPYTIIKRKGIKIAVLGLITPAVPQWLPPDIYSGIQFEDMIESAKKWVKIINEKEHPDLLIGLFHSGVDYSYNGETAETYKNENASKLVAEQVAGFNVVFVGHDHAGWNFNVAGPAGDSVLIVGPTSRARNVAVANLTMNYNPSDKEWINSDLSGEIVDMKNYPSSNRFLQKFERQRREIENYVSQPVCVLQKTISTRDALFGPSEFINLVQKFQLETTGADVSFASPLSFNASIDSGTVYVKDLFKLYHYENFLYTMRLSGKEIIDYLEFSFGNWFNQMNGSHDHLLKFKKNSDGSMAFSERNNRPALDWVYYNFSSAAGIDYTVDVSKPEGNRVIIGSMADGSEFDPEKFYTVAINSYRGNGGGGHLIRGAGIPKEELSRRIINSNQKEIRYLLMEWLRKKEVINPEKPENWKIIPEDWWEKGKEKDYQLLFK